MNAHQWKRAKEICVAALKLTPQVRKAYLEEELREDLPLLAEVNFLLSFELRAQENFKELSSEVVMAAFESSVTLIGSRIGNYQVRSLLGWGGMGEVYLAEDTTLGREVALKVLPQEFVNDEQPLQRFKQEARAASGLKHRNIITIYSVGQENGVYFIATEYVPGPTLRQRLLASGRMELPVAVETAIQIASALEAAHDAGIVHRDVKPENIMFERDGTAKLLDFGIAKLTEHLTSEANGENSDLLKTEQGVILGTPAYMSPEQARHQPLDHRSDLFSLGVVLYEMITGSVPFPGGTPYDQQASVLVSEPTPLERHLDRVIPELQWVIGKALTKEQGRRYQTSTDLLIDLQLLAQILKSAENALSEISNPNDLTPTTTRITGTFKGQTLRGHRRWRISYRRLVAIGLLAVVFILVVTVFPRVRGWGVGMLGLQGPPPQIESIVPNRPVDIIGNQPIEVHGNHFQDGLKMKVEFPNGESNELAGTQIQKVAGKNTTFSILIDFNGNPGTYAFQVFNPDGQTSARFLFEARHETQRPAINWIEPSNVKKSGGEQLLAIYGSNFQIGVRIEVIQPDGETSELRDRQIVNRTPNSFHGLFFFHRPGKHSIRAVNPNGGKSDYFDILVQ